MNNIDLNGAPAVGEELSAIADDSAVLESDNAVATLSSPVTSADTDKQTGANETPAEKLFEAEPPPMEQADSPATDKNTYWHSVLTGDPTTVPTEVYDRCGANDAGLSPEQRE